METCGQYIPTQTRTLHSTERIKEKILDLEKDCFMRMTLTGLFNKNVLPYRLVGLPHFHCKTSSNLVWPEGGNVKFEKCLFPQLLAVPHLPHYCGHFLISTPMYPQLPYFPHAHGLVNTYGSVLIS